MIDIQMTRKMNDVLEIDNEVLGNEDEAVKTLKAGNEAPGWRCR